MGGHRFRAHLPTGWMNGSAKGSQRASRGRPLGMLVQRVAMGASGARYAWRHQDAAGDLNGSNYSIRTQEGDIREIDHKMLTPFVMGCTVHATPAGAGRILGRLCGFLDDCQSQWTMELWFKAVTAWNTGRVFNRFPVLAPWARHMVLERLT